MAASFSTKNVLAAFVGSLLASSGEGVHAAKSGAREAILKNLGGGQLSGAAEGMPKDAKAGMKIEGMMPIDAKVGMPIEGTMPIAEMPIDAPAKCQSVADSCEAQELVKCQQKLLDPGAFKEVKASKCKSYLHSCEAEQLSSCMQELNSANEEDIQRLEAEKLQLQGSLRELAVRYADLETTAGADAAKIETLNAEILQLNNQPCADAAEINSLNAEIAQLNNQAGTNEATINSLNAEIAQLKNQAETDATTINSLNADIVSLNNQCAAGCYTQELCQQSAAYKMCDDDRYSQEKCQNSAAYKILEDDRYSEERCQNSAAYKHLEQESYTDERCKTSGVFWAMEYDRDHWKERADTFQKQWLDCYHNIN